MPPALQIVRWLLLPAAMAFAFWRIMAIHLADWHLEQNRPEAALYWNPRHPEALLRLALARLDSAPEAARQLLLQARQANPADGRIHLALGLLDERADALPSAEQMMQAAHRLAPQRLDVQLALGYYRLRRDDPVAAMRHFDRVLASGSSLAQEELFPLLLTLVAQPGWLESAIVPLLAQAPSWWPHFLQHATPAAALPLLLELHRLSDAFPYDDEALRPARRSLLHRLQQAGEWQAAQVFWLNLLPAAQQKQVDNLFNGGFDLPLSHQGFDWIVSPLPQVGISTPLRPEAGKGKALRLEFRGGRIEYRHLRQHLMLLPGDYVLQGEFRPQGFFAAEGLQWRLYCGLGDHPPLVGSPLFAGHGPWQPFSVSFRIPARDCPGQTLRLEAGGRTAADYELRGSLWFDELKIVHINSSR